MIKIYSPLGAPLIASSAGRCYLLLEELGIPYETVGVDMKNGAHKAAPYLEINPNGKVPTMNDDGFILWESMAINDYLAKKHKPELLGKDLKDQSSVTKWNYWVIGEYQLHLVQILVQNRMPEEKRNNEAIANAKAKLNDLHKMLDKEIKGNTYLVGSSYTLADLHVSLSVSVCMMFGFDLTQTPNLDKYVKEMISRPAFQKLQSQKPKH
jgi:glutathione S-transferase